MTLSNNVKSKIQRLLQDLDLSESGGVDAAMVADSAGSAELDELMGTLKQMAGTNEPVKNDTAVHEYQDDVSSVTTDDTDQERFRGQRHAVISEKYQYLERKALQLMADNKALTLTLDSTIRQKDMQIHELQSHLTKVVKEVEERQRAVETQAPLLRLRAQDFKQQLKDLKISDARHAELKALPEDSLAAVDLVKIAVYEETCGLKQDNERLRLAMSAARETSARAEEEAARLRLENARVSAALVEKEKDVQVTVDSLQSRVDRLASELEAAMVRAELLSAKGQMYDEVKSRADRLQEDNLRLQVIEANHRRLDEQCRELQLLAKDKTYQHELLVQDKAYLAQQVEFLVDAQRRLQSDLEGKESKIFELQKQKQDLFDKLVQTETLKNKEDEKRLQRELALLQNETQASIGRIRTDTAEAYDREARLLRELRDQAQEDASRAKIALSDLQVQYEQQQLATADMQRKLESQIVALQAEVKTKAFEVSHLNVVVGEKDSLLQRATLQAELLQEKLQISMDRVRALDSQLSIMNNSTAAAAALPSPANTNHPQTNTASSPATTQPHARDNTQQLQLLQQESAITNELVSELRTQIRNLEREKEQVVSQARSLQSSLSSCQAALSLAGQPHSFILQQLQAAKDAAAQAETRALDATAALKTKEQEVGSARKEVEGLKTDLQAVLQSRGQLQGLKQLLLRTMGVPLPSTGPSPSMAAVSVGHTVPGAATAAVGQYQQQQVTGGGSGGGSRVPQAVPRPATTIIGEGQ